MLREPRRSEKKVEPRKEGKQNRFRITKLEERIAPKCFYNEHAGKEVGNCKATK